ncbi:MAG: hypothetical protein QE271_07830 [Bacteriovoracaceae bacterium]|nr:hypothetical protein [Bacteriovoracaceae bacterium]
MKPGGLILRSIRPTIINSFVIERIEIDLKHINYGLDPKKGYGQKARSTFVIEDIIRFFESLNGMEIEFNFDDGWEYFVVDKSFFDKMIIYRMVFCIDHKEPSICGIITFFQIKRGVH